MIDEQAERQTDRLKIILPPSNKSGRQKDRHVLLLCFINVIEGLNTLHVYNTLIYFNGRRPIAYVLSAINYFVNGFHVHFRSIIFFDWKPERESRNIWKFMLNNVSQFVSIKTNIVNLFQYFSLMDNMLYDVTVGANGTEIYIFRIIVKNIPHNQINFLIQSVSKKPTN